MFKFQKFPPVFERSNSENQRGFDKAAVEAGVISGPSSENQVSVGNFQMGIANADFFNASAMADVINFGRCITLTRDQHASPLRKRLLHSSVTSAQFAFEECVYLRPLPIAREITLTQQRDLMPTSDMRNWAGHAVQGLFGFDKRLIMTDDPKPVH